MLGLIHNISVTNVTVSVSLLCFLSCHCRWKGGCQMLVMRKPEKGSWAWWSERSCFEGVPSSWALYVPFKRIVCNQLITSVVDRMDPLQFAYRARRGVEDATLTLFDLIYSYLDSAGTTVRNLCMDFSSAFNSIQPHVLIKMLLDLDINTDLILWIRQFLCDRPQRVRRNSRFCDQPVLSDGLVLNTDVPQGCVLSPVLVCFYKWIHMQWPCSYFDQVPRWYGPDQSTERRVLSFSVLLADRHVKRLVQITFLELNVSKTKELICGSGKDNDRRKQIEWNGQKVEVVHSFKYLGTVVDQKLTSTQHVDSVFKKAQQRLFLLRKLIHFGVSQGTLEMVYMSDWKYSGVQHRNLIRCSHCKKTKPDCPV